MCGIVGYIGRKEALPILETGLERLEYRGYDSVGIALLNNNRFNILKRKGRIANLKSLFRNRIEKGRVGIGHTRWATHGEVTDYNAHPHTDCKNEIAIVHNGIIENFRELKKDLKDIGHIFKSDTDSEVIAHLIEEFYKQCSLEKAVELALNRIKGSYALAITSLREPNKLIGAKLRSPLIVGISGHGYFLASDVPALLDYTKEVIFVNDGEMVILKDKSYEIVDLKGNLKQEPVQLIDWDISFAEKNGFPHFMLKEIHEQPQILENNINLRIKVNKIDLGIEPEFLKKFHKLTIVACGTAYHAAMVGQYLIEKIAKIPVRIETSSEFRYRKIPLKKDSFFIAISQSGETADTIASMELASKKGLKVLSIINVMGSTIARSSDLVIYTYAGPEIGVASTKTYLAQVLILHLLALELARINKTQDEDFIIEYINELKKIPFLAREILEEEKLDIKNLALSYANYSNFLYLGRGINYPSALEGALKLKEISYIHAEGYAGGEMKHGPIALIDENFPVIAICPESLTIEKMFSNILEIKARKGKVISIITEGNDEIKAVSDSYLSIPPMKEELTSFLVPILLQLFAYYLAVERGCDVDRPRNLAKSVTVE
jgi:glucosamine--fructose-6-phosphate aminotransferase (isomerizing)